MMSQPWPASLRHSDESAGARIGVQSIARIIAAAVCGLHRVDEEFVRVNAALGDDGYIDVEVTRVDFSGTNVTERVLLYPTAPVPVPPRAGPGSTGAA
jgi:hypothetical protein